MLKVLIAFLEEEIAEAQRLAILNKPEDNGDHDFHQGRISQCQRFLAVLEEVKASIKRGEIKQ